MIPVLSEYLKYFEEYRAKYGDRVAVLMQVGSFYEVYGVEGTAGNGLGNAEELSHVLNVVLTRRNKRVPANSINNPLMLGFPCQALDKYTSVLVEEDYTVVVVNQERAQSGISRKVVDVVSPSINMGAGAPTGSAAPSDNCLVLVHTDKHGHLGMSAISVLTGSSVVYECYHNHSDPDKSMDEALGFLKQHRPREVVLSGECIDGLDQHLELGSVLCHKNPASCRKRPSVEYQNSVLGLAFDNDSMLSNIEYLGIERHPYALLSYVFLIEFVYDHNPVLLKRMLHPVVQSAAGMLVLSAGAVDQLDVVGRARQRGSKEGHTLLGTVNRCLTSQGRRLLTRRVLAPSASAREIDTRYSQVEELGLLPSNALQGVGMLLKAIVDIERLQRRMLIGIVTPSELASAVVSYEAVIGLDSLIRAEADRLHLVHLRDAFMGDSPKGDLGSFVDMCRYVFDVDSMLTSGIAFNAGVFDGVDKLRERIQMQVESIRGIARGIGIKNPRVEHCSVGYFVHATSQQARSLHTGAHGVTVKRLSSSCRVTSPGIDAASREIAHLSTRLERYTRVLYKSTVERLLSYSGMFCNVVSFVSIMDVVNSNLTTSRLYSYCRPSVVEGGVSFVDAKTLRHPVIERLDNGEPYVPNDVSLGRAHNGIVLYSMNSCGKTSLLRALGLSVILAQAGCFVPASSFSFTPFRCIMTRILSKDNIMKGQSSFVAEMAELRAILRRANDGSTLVLADEITHGTEHTSGSSIFVSSVETLASRKVNFLLTTHLHNVHPLVQGVANVRVLHLSVAFSGGKIVFERKLKDGPGGSVYGLEVCELLGMDTAFIARAFQVRAMITPDRADNYIKAKPIPSRYNAKKMVQHCEGCGYCPRALMDSPLHTHHVEHRALADANGMIGSMHKNALHNLRVLCKECHAKEHEHAPAHCATACKA